MAHAAGCRFWQITLHSARSHALVRFNWIPALRALEQARSLLSNATRINEIHQGSPEISCSEHWSVLVKINGFLWVATDFQAFSLQKCSKKSSKIKKKTHFQGHCYCCARLFSEMAASWSKPLGIRSYYVIWYCGTNFVLPNSS